MYVVSEGGCSLFLSLLQKRVHFYAADSPNKLAVN